MSLLFETIKLQDGVLHNLEFHNFRMNQSRKEIFGSSDSIHLRKLIRIPASGRNGTFKCKVMYGKQVEDIQFEPYTPRKIQSLKLIEDNTILYSYKYSDRYCINKLFGERGNCDDILIVKNGLITDASFANIICYDGSQWVTPANPLLHGTMRSYLLRNRLITKKDINVTDLMHFMKIRLVNAMLPFEPASDILPANISF